MQSWTSLWSLVFRSPCCWSLFWFFLCSALQEGGTSVVSVRVCDRRTQTGVFSPPAGCGIAHGHPAASAVSSPAVVFEPPPSEQLYSGGSSSAETHSGEATVRPGNHRTVASSHVQHEDGDSASSVTNPGEELRPEKPPAQRSKHKKPTFLHPLPLLVKQTQTEPIEGLSFPTVQYFKRFVESMKNAFLTPGKDLRRYFQTARDVLEHDFTSDAPDPTADSRPDASTERQSTSSGGNEEDVHLQKLSVPKSSLDGDSGLSALAWPAADGGVSEGVGGSEAGDVSAHNRDIQPVSLRLTEQKPPGSFLGELASAEALLGPAHGAAPDLDPKTSDETIQESDSENSSKYEKASGGFQLGGVQTKDLREKIPADAPYSPEASPRVGRINKGNVSSLVPKDGESLSSSSQTHQSVAGGEESKGLYRSILHLPVFASSSNAELAPRDRWGQAGGQLSGPHVPEYEAFGRRQPLRSQHVEPSTVFGSDEPRQTSEDVQAVRPGGPDSAQRWTLPPYKVGYGWHFTSDLARPSDSIFWRKTGQKENFRNSKMRNRISVDPKGQSSFVTLRTRGATLQGVFVGPAEAARPHASIQDTLYQPPLPKYAFKSRKRGAFPRRSRARRGRRLSLPFYIQKSGSNYFRSKVSFLKSHYAPN